MHLDSPRPQNIRYQREFLSFCFRARPSQQKALGSIAYSARWRLGGCDRVKDLRLELGPRKNPKVNSLGALAIADKDQKCSYGIPAPKIGRASCRERV